MSEQTDLEWILERIESANDTDRLVQIGIWIAADVDDRADYLDNGGLETVRAAWAKRKREVSGEITWREQYGSVISSLRWKQIKNRFIDRLDGKCQCCGWCGIGFDKTRTLELHHKTYDRLGFELDEDLELLCSPCHEKADEQRAESSQKKAQAALESAQFSGWAIKVYGDDYEAHSDFFNDAMYERFLKWKERKEVSGD